MLTKPDQLPVRPGNRVLSRQWLLLILLGLAVATAYQQYRRYPHYRVQVFATQNGWGYTILDGKTALIHQPTVPGGVGRQGFASNEQARRVGEQVMHKLQTGGKLPTLTPTELHQLGVAVH